MDKNKHITLAIYCCLFALFGTVTVSVTPINTEAAKLAAAKIAEIFKGLSPEEIAQVSKNTPEIAKNLSSILDVGSWIGSAGSKVWYSAWHLRQSFGTDIPNWISAHPNKTIGISVGIAAYLYFKYGYLRTIQAEYGKLLEIISQHKKGGCQGACQCVKTQADKCKTIFGMQDRAIQELIKSESGKDDILKLYSSAPWFSFFSWLTF